MKFLHTGDLHIGKRLFEASVLEDQAHILEQIYEIAFFPAMIHDFAHGGDHRRRAAQAALCEILQACPLQRR